MMIDSVREWFAQRVPEGWRHGELEVLADDDEVLVVVALDPADGEAEISARIAEFRAETKDERIRIAREAERLFRRKVSWGARSGETRQLFTSLGVPVMTRLRLPDRALLDTLVESGVARSRSEAVAWCVRLVGRHESDWVEQLRQALVDVRRLREEGPRAS